MKMTAEETIQKIISELEKIAFADFSHISGETDNEAFAEFVHSLAKYEKFFPAISQVKTVKDGVEIKFYDKLKAIELLGKYIKQQEGDDADSDFDNLISVLQGKAERIWKGGDTD